MRTSIVLLYLFIIVFAAGIAIGYFLERSGIVYTEAEIDKLRLEVENMQLQEMFISGSSADCKLLFSSMGKLSYDLYNLVNRLQAESPDTQAFRDAKVQADFLSLKAWILARTVRETCTEELLPVLFRYSVDCTECQEQDQVLQGIKGDHESVLVYSIDFGSEEAALKLVRDAYQIEGTPSVIIGNEVFGQIGSEELEDVVCGQIAC